MRLEVNDVIECKIDDMGMYGEGIAHIEGLTVFIPSAVTGERVSARVVLVKSASAHAVLKEVLSPSPNRITPPCPYFRACGGCSLQHVSYSGQLELKRAAVENAFKKIAGFAAGVEEVCPSPIEYRYRNKISLPVRFDPKRGAVRGFFAKRSHRVEDIEDCLIQKRETVECALKAADFAMSLGLKPYDENSGAGDLRHVTARLLGGKLSLTFVLNGYKESFSRELKRRTSNFMPEGSALFLNYNSVKNNVILGQESTLLLGNGLTDINGYTVENHPQAFFQVNDGVRDLLYAEVCGLVGAEKSVIDAYSGAGLMSAMLCQKAERVTAIEISPDAVASAKRLKESRGIDNLTLKTGDCGELLGKELDAAANKDNCTVVLDPPKTGCDRKVTDALNAARNVKKIVYVSCNPATLARDCALLTAGGFSVEKVKPYDMFPQTTAVETLALLTRG